MSESELKPCPFCSCIDIEITTSGRCGWAECTNCDATGSNTVFDFVTDEHSMTKREKEEVKEKVTETWNTRPVREHFTVGKTLGDISSVLLDVLQILTAEVTKANAFRLAAYAVLKKESRGDERAQEFWANAIDAEIDYQKALQPIYAALYGSKEQEETE